MSTENEVDDPLADHSDKLSSFARRAGKSCADQTFTHAGAPERVGLDETQLAMVCAITVASTMHAVEKHLADKIGPAVARLLILPMANV